MAAAPEPCRGGIRALAFADFPTSLPSFQRMFPDERACFEYLVRARWPAAFRCPGCGGAKAYPLTRRLALECAACRKILSATAGTVMHGTRQPLGSWLLAAFLLVVDKRGISAVQLQRALGIKRHEVAYQMLHRLRAAMVAPERQPLRGLVEVDETFIGGVQRGLGRGSRKGGQEAVVGAVEVHGKRTPGRLRLTQIPDKSQACIMAFVRANIETDSTIRTDGGGAYARVLDAGYNHEIISTVDGFAADEVLPTLHLAFANLKTWLQGTFHGAVRREHLQAYLNEFVFRFNRRRNLQAAFQRVLGIGTAVAGPTYAALYDGSWSHANTGMPPRRSRGAPPANPQKPGVQ